MFADSQLTTVIEGCFWECLNIACIAFRGAADALRADLHPDAGPLFKHACIVGCLASRGPILRILDGRRRTSIGLNIEVVGELPLLWNPPGFEGIL